VALPPASLLYAAIDSEAVRRARNELPRTPDDDACRCERLRQAVALVLSGEPLHSAARYTGWAPLTFERMLVHSLTAERADELVAASCELTPSHRRAGKASRHVLKLTEAPRVTAVKRLNGRLQRR
jgi:hypothetical protein